MVVSKRIIPTVLSALLAVSSVTFSLSSKADAQYPVREAGQPSRVALIYSGYAMSTDGPFQRLWKKENFQPYLTYTQVNPQTGQRVSKDLDMFDTFLFLSPYGSNHMDSKGLFDLSGMDSTKSPGTKADWQGWLDGNFIKGAQFDALAQAVKDYARPLSPTYKAKMMVMVPYPYRSQTQWDQGISFADTQNRIAAVRWFIDEFMKKYQVATTSFDGQPLSSYIDFVGFYWMRENFTDGKNLDEGTVVQSVNQYVDGKKLGSYVIPYTKPEVYPASVYPWGFDKGWLQPTYYFSGDKDQLSIASLLARKYQLGVELETNWESVSSDSYLQRFRDYINFGSENGWMSTLLALYSDMDMYGKSTFDKYLEAKGVIGDKLRKTYDDLHLFLNDRYNPHSLTTTAAVSTSVGAGGIHNTHAIDLQAGQTWTFTLQTKSGDADLFLVDDQFKRLARSERLNLYSDRLVYTVPKTGRYYVQVYGKTNSTYTIALQPGSDQTGESPTTASGLAVGANRTETLRDKEDRFYRMQVEAGQTYTVTVAPDATNMNPDLYLFADDVSSQAAYKSVRGPAGAEQITFTPSTSGPYYLQLRGELPSSYTLRTQLGVVPRPIDGYEAATAFPLAANQLVSPPVVRKESLWYKVPVEAGKTYTFLTQPASSQDTDLDLYSENGVQKLASSQRGKGLTDAILYNATTSGNVLVKITAYEDGSAPLQVLSGNQMPAGYVPERPKMLTEQDAFETSPNAPMYYAVSLEGGKQYRLTLTSEAGKNADIDVYNARQPIDSARVASSHLGVGVADSVTVHPKQSGIYLVKVSGQVQTRYQVSLEQVKDNGASPDVALPLTPTAPLTGSLQQDQEFYAKVDLEKGKMYRFTAMGMQANQDIDMDVYSAPIVDEAHLIARSHAPAGAVDSVTFTSTRSETAYVRVKGYSKGEYRLQVEIVAVAGN